MGFLLGAVGLVVAVAFATANRSSRSRGARIVAVVVAPIGVLAAVGGVGAFVGAARGDTGDMARSATVFLGCLYLALGIGSLAIAWNTFRPPGTDDA